MAHTTGSLPGGVGVICLIRSFCTPGMDRFTSNLFIAFGTMTDEAWWNA